MSKKTTQNANNGGKIFNIEKITTASFSLIWKGGGMVALALLVAIAFWQKDTLKDWLGFNRFFSKNDNNFKILVLPFKQVCVQSNKNYDAGFVLTGHLQEIIHKEKLKIAVQYWNDYDFKCFNDQVAKDLQDYHYADMIIYGDYTTEDCNSEGGQICVNYITDEKWKLGDVGINLERKDPLKGGFTELQKGKIQEKVENLATFISVISQVKNISREKYLTLIKELLNKPNIGESGKAYIYTIIADKLGEEGKLEEPLSQYEKALTLYKEKGNKEMMGFCFSRIGNIYTSLGNLEKALPFFEQDLALTKEYSEANKNNVRFKEHLGISYSKLGDIYNTLGNFEKASKYFEIQTKLFEELYEANKNNVSFKNGLIISYLKLGEIKGSLGNLEKALMYFEIETKLSEELFETNKNNVSFKSGLAISYSKLGETHTSLGNLAKALIFFEKFNQLMQEVYETNKNNIEFRNNLAISYAKLGETHNALGNFSKALTFFEQFNQLEKYLYETNKNNVSFKNGLAVSYSKLGETHNALGNFNRALIFFEERNRLGKELYEANKSNIFFKNGLAVSYWQLGEIYKTLKRETEMIAAYQKSNELCKSLFDTFPLNVEYKSNLAETYLSLGQTYLSQDKTKAKNYFLQAKSLWNELVRDAPQNAQFKRYLEIVQKGLKDLK